MAEEIREQALTQKELVNILFRYHAVLKIAKVYEFNNEMVQDQIGKLYTSLHETLEREGDVVLRLRQSSVYINGVRVKFDYSNYHVFKFIFADFQSKEIAAIAFSPGLTEDELQRFVQIMLHKDLDSKTAYAQIIQAIDSGRIDHIMVEKMTPVELQVSREKSAVRILSPQRCVRETPTAWLLQPQPDQALDAVHFQPCR
jgi:nitric oxide reductase activation protein